MDRKSRCPNEYVLLTRENYVRCEVRRPRRGADHTSQGICDLAGRRFVRFE